MTHGIDSRLRILVVEDDPQNVGDMEKAIRTLCPGIEKKITNVATRAQAQQVLLSQRFHVVSHDLYLAADSGASRVANGVGQIDADASGGRTIMQGPGSSVLVRRMVYTGFRVTDEGQRTLDAAAQRGILYLQKGVTDLARFPPVGNAFAWAACLIHLANGQTDDPSSQDLLALLQSNADLAPRLLPYFESYWRDAPTHLPEPLAREAARIHEAVQHGHFNADQVLAINRFRMWALVLARAETAALARSLAPPQATGGRLRWPGQFTFVRDEDEALRTQLEPLFDRADVALEPVWQQWPSWLSHLGGFKVGGGLALGPQARALRTARNQEVHSLKTARAVKLRVIDLREPLLALMDVAAYWADYPWFINLRFAQGRWLGDAPVGQGISDRRTISMPEGVVGLGRSQQGVAEHVHQVQWRREGGAANGGDDINFVPQLVDGWPWLRRHRQNDGSDTVLALWYPVRQQGRETVWQGYTFAGEGVEVRVADTDW